MTTVQPAQVDNNDSRGVTVTWTGADTNDGLGFACLGFGELTAQAIGNGTSITWQGSNDGGTTWGALGAGASTSTTSSPILRITEHPALIRPLFVGGTSTKAILCAAKQFY